MNPATKMLMLAAATVLVSGTTTMLVTRSAIRRRCTQRVVSSCMKLPLTSSGFCMQQARAVCKG